MFSYIMTAAISALVGCGGGIYLHYKFGSQLAALEAKVKSVV